MKKINCLLFASLLVLIGCKSKSKTTESQLPLPPTVDGGLVNGEFVQVDYGFAFPVPAKWNYLRLSADQEVDEVGRFSDPSREAILRMAVELLGPNEKFSSKTWVDMAEKDLIDHQFKVTKKGSPKEWKTSEDEVWAQVPFQIVDPKGGEWTDEEWGLNKDDMLIIAHITLPQDLAESDKGKKLLKLVAGSLTQIHWYMPIGSRGISIERYELRQFTDNFCQALVSRSVSKTNPYFDDMYPERAKWADWYQQAVSGDPKATTLKAELSGLVINGDDATATFTLTKKSKDGSKPVKMDRSFKLSKKEGSWQITASMDKK